MEAAKPKFMMAKVKELKVLDAKSAQNICTFLKKNNCQVTLFTQRVCLTLSVLCSPSPGVAAYGLC